MDKKNTKLELDNIVSTILADYKEDRIINKTDVSDQPDSDAVIEPLSSKAGTSMSSPSGRLSPPRASL